MRMKPVGLPVLSYDKVRMQESTYGFDPSYETLYLACGKIIGDQMLMCITKIPASRMCGVFRVEKPSPECLCGSCLVISPAANVAGTIAVGGFHLPTAQNMSAVRLI